jgi:hypothetical protein
MTEAEKRAFVQRRAAHCCEYCRFPAAHLKPPMHFDHVKARQHGGLDEIENLALSCSRCNQAKGPNIATIDPDGDGVSMVPLFNPRNDDWNDHFELLDGVMVGKSAIGRATVFLLNMNKPVRIAMRRELIRQGAWPTA